MSKSANTKAFIIATVAPIFNKNGYAGMSLSKITRATGLTKGAIYGHFKNKEELALEAFRFSVRNVLKDLNKKVSEGKSPLVKLKKVADFYNNYYQYTQIKGGCPILNIGVDSNNQNTIIGDLVRSYNHRILEQFENLIEAAKVSQEIHQDIDSMVYAKRFFYMIEGAIYMSYVMKDQNYLNDVSMYMKKIIQQDLEK